MKIKIVALDCQGSTGLELEEKRYYIDAEGKERTASRFEAPSMENIKEFYERINKALDMTGKLKLITNEQSIAEMVSFTTNLYSAGHCLVENTIIWDILHRVKIAGKLEDVDKMVDEKPIFMKAYKPTFDRLYDVKENLDLDLESFDSISDLEKALNLLEQSL